MKENKKSNQVWLSTTLIVSCFVLLCINGFYQPAAQANQTSTEQGKILIVTGQSRVLQAPWPTVRVAVTDPVVANVQILTPTQILLQGLKVGSTDLILWNEDETQIWQLSINVILDVEAHQQKLDTLFPDCELELDESGNLLLVKGVLRNVDQAEKLREYLEKTDIQYVDMTSVAGIQQVQLEVRIAEVSRASLRTLTVNAIYADHPFFGLIAPTTSSGTPLVSDITWDNSYWGTTWTATTAVTILAGVPRANFDIFIKALAENQYLRILANPTLVALSGEEASFLAGGEFPVPVPQAGGTTNTITIQYKEYGIRLTFRPIVLGDGTIKLYTAPEVSELTAVGSVTLEGFEVPAVTTRKAETTLKLKSGQTFAMAGLLRNNVDAVSAKVPGLGDLPVLGPLFRSVRYSKEETELIILVTAVLVEPMSLAEAPPLPGFLHSEPNDWEFYIDGKIDGAEKPKLCPADAEWMRQMGLDNLIGPGAWDYYDNPAAPSKADIEPVEIIGEQSSYNYYQSDVSEEKVVSSGNDNGLNSVIYVTDLKE